VIVYHESGYPPLMKCDAKRVRQDALGALSWLESVQDWPPEPVPCDSRRSLHPQGTKRRCQRVRVAPLALPQRFGCQPGLDSQVPVVLPLGSLWIERWSWGLFDAGLAPSSRLVRGGRQVCASQPDPQEPLTSLQEGSGVQAISSGARLALFTTLISALRHGWQCVSTSAMVRRIHNVWERARAPVPIRHEREGARAIWRLA
jgi:hypothetical protein